MMSLPFQIGFSVAALLLLGIGLSFLIVPERASRHLSGFLNPIVMHREKTENGRIWAIRTQGLIAVAVGSFFALFVWALR
jgi:hypothetical protein